MSRFNEINIVSGKSPHPLGVGVCHGDFEMNKFLLFFALAFVLLAAQANAYTENLYFKDGSVLNKTVNAGADPYLSASVATTTDGNYSLGTWTSSALKSIQNSLNAARNITFINEGR